MVKPILFPLYSKKASSVLGASNRFALIAVLAGALAVSGCVFGGDSDGPGAQAPVPEQVAAVDDNDDSGFLSAIGKILPGGGDDKDKIPGGVAPVMGINSYLWRSTLDTLSFMPLQSADPVGGVIITDWYANPEAPDERFKVTVYILDQRLRADGIKVSVFKQTRRGGNWLDAAVDPETPGNIEDAILTRARQLRVAQFEDD